jgi:hypothetical protein
VQLFAVMKYCIYLNARQSFFCTFGACEVPNWTMESRTKAGIIICNQKGEQSMPKVIGHIFFLLCPLSNILKKHNILAAGCVSVFNQRNTMLLDCLGGAILFHWAPYKQ